MLGSSRPSRNRGWAIIAALPWGQSGMPLRFVGLQEAILLQIVHFYESNSGGVVCAAHDRGVVAPWSSAMIADSEGLVGA